MLDLMARMGGLHAPTSASHRQREVDAFVAEVIALRGGYPEEANIFEVEVEVEDADVIEPPTRTA